MKDLTPKQEAFVRWYTTPGDTLYNATASARKAGYKGNENTIATVGWQNLRKPAIQRALRAVWAEAFKVTDLTVDSVIAELEQHRVLALAAGDHGAANKALELKGKYLKMFADRVEHVHSIEDATDEELVGLLNELTGKLDGVDISRIAGISGGGKSSGGGDTDPPGAPTTH